jgi:uncharacterized membrane protein YgcG
MLHDIYIKYIVQHFYVHTRKVRKIMAISIDDYLNSVSAITAVTQNQAAGGSATQTTSSTTGDKDSYIASEIDPDAVLPSENYNDILKVMQSAKAENASTSTDSGSSSGAAASSGSGDTEAVGGAGGAGGGGGSDDDDDEDETTTEVVTINGVTYLETTTVSEGITTVTRTAIGDADE